ncbi:hypothetical protein CEXT_606931 [Caerostris extrusa]|uniref:Uncharacterized protein n=1 Tax=Caerostris extrusa TaxID=172846 RepID=A0AAV4NL61_CAEEX|nr:hypothetical protein CEXT_606931 [Caerostris extrusa]
MPDFRKVLNINYDSAIKWLQLLSGGVLSGVGLAIIYKMGSKVLLNHTSRHACTAIVVGTVGMSLVNSAQAPPPW